MQHLDPNLERMLTFWSTLFHNLSPSTHKNLNKLEIHGSLTLEIVAWPKMSSGHVGSSIHRGLNSANLLTQLMASATSHRWLASIIWYKNIFRMLFRDTNAIEGARVALPKCYWVQSFALWGGTCVCRPQDLHRLSPWTSSICSWVHLCRAAETHT